MTADWSFVIAYFQRERFFMRSLCGALSSAFSSDSVWPLAIKLLWMIPASTMGLFSNRKITHFDQRRLKRHEKHRVQSVWYTNMTLCCKAKFVVWERGCMQERAQNTSLSTSVKWKKQQNLTKRDTGEFPLSHLPATVLNVEELPALSSFDRQITHVRASRQLKIKWLVCCHGDMLHL